MGAKRWQNVIVHVDLDAFFASVEQRDDPSLRGRPVIVGGGGRRGVVSTCSYEARAYGVKSAMPVVLAKRLCPHGVYLAPRMPAYAAASKAFMAVLSRHSPSVEPLSLDEAFLDATGTEELFGTPMDFAWRLQRAVREELHLSCAVGVAPSKFVAKVASDQKKPGGIVVVTPGEERAFLAPLPIERLWGVGPKTSEKLRADGYSVIDDLARADEKDLVTRYGTLGEHLSRLSRGIDDRLIEPDHERKSLGAERTLEHDISGVTDVRRQLLPLVDEVAAGLRKAGLRASGVRVKIKYADFHRTSRERMVPEPICDTASLTAAVDQLLPKLDLAPPIRLVGLAATHLVDDRTPRQVSLFEAAAPVVEKAEALGRALDLINAKHGKNGVVRGDLPTRDRDALDRGVEHLDD